MTFHHDSPRSRILVRAAAVVLLSGFAAACSTSSMTTGATSPGTPPAYTGQPMPPALVGTNPIAGGQATADQYATGPNAGVTTAALPPPPGGNYTQQPPAAQQVAMAAPTAQSSVITAESGDTLYSLSRRFGVSVAAIAAANNLTQTSMLTIGQRVIIPAAGSTGALGTPPAPLGVITTAGTAPAANGAPAQTAAAPGANTGTPGSHVVQPGETIYSIALAYGISPNALAQANNMAQPELVRSGQTLVIPGATRAPAAGPTVVAAASPAVATPPPTATPAPTPVPAAPQPTATPAPAAPPATVAAANPQVPVEAPSVNGVSFRWPARGRTISDFGPKPGGERNDGINIALPEGTEIKASEAGVVIYAGNEIPGYGNLVLIRHADNWVTAYAHTSQMLVAKDQTVSRGQTIALVGATGSVTSPQLHFELRRGSTPVNPLDYLVN